MRADFYDRPLKTPGLVDMMHQCMVIVPPLSGEELQEVIVQPAAQSGVLFEAGQVAAIVTDIGEQPGALPLLQYALTELFERRQERLLTFDHDPLTRAPTVEVAHEALNREWDRLKAWLDESR